jgi:lipid II:glycine glycyltransferase (peptidoglycan interpeptide bridge formation enzyme)
MSAQFCNNLVAPSIIDGCPPASSSVTVQEAELREWDAFLARTPGGSYQQTGAWAIAKLMERFRARRFTIKASDVILGGAQLLIRRLPIGGAIGYVPLGPVLASDDPEVAHLAVTNLHRIAGERNVSCLAVQAPRWGQAFANKLQSVGFSPALRDLAPNASVVIDLSNSLDFILSKMRKTTRHHIRAGQRNGITIREGRLEDLDAVHKLLAATARRQGFSVFKQEYLCEVWEQFSRRGFIKMFIAEFDRRVVSAIVTMAFGDTEGWLVRRVWQPTSKRGVALDGNTMGQVPGLPLLRLRGHSPGPREERPCRRFHKRPGKILSWLL